MTGFSIWLENNSDYEGFIHSLRTNPSPSNWLIFADWLDENNRTSTAGFIRAVVAYSQGKRGKNILDIIRNSWDHEDSSLKNLINWQFRIPVLNVSASFNISFAEATQVLKLVNKKWEDTEGSEAALSEINNIIRGHGVEAVRSEDTWDSYYMDIVGLYVNTGDTYKLTVVYDIPRDKLLITDLGTWIEKNQRRYRII